MTQTSTNQGQNRPWLTDYEQIWFGCTASNESEIGCQECGTLRVPKIHDLKSFRNLDFFYTEYEGKASICLRRVILEPGARLSAHAGLQARATQGRSGVDVARCARCTIPDTGRQSRFKSATRLYRVPESRMYVQGRTLLWGLLMSGWLMCIFRRREAHHATSGGAQKRGEEEGRSRGDRIIQSKCIIIFILYYIYYYNFQRPSEWCIKQSNLFGFCKYTAKFSPFWTIMQAYNCTIIPK